MPKRSPGAKAKGIGAQLRALREEASLSLRAAAAAVGWDKGRLSRIETGSQNSTVEDVAALLAILGVTGDRRDQLLALVRNDDAPGWWEKNLGVTKESATLADYESQATALVDWAPLLVPGLLQTMDYAHAFGERYSMSPDDIGLRLSARAQRQRAVAGTPYTAYLGETALRTVVGNRRVMAAQLAALLDRDDITVRVVPVTATAHLGQLGAFLLLRFPAAPAVVHVELLRSGVFLDDPRLTSPYEDAVTQVAGVALGETESARLIGVTRREMEA
jgi:transcriptional regulator with XRE-family HTH domain